VRAEKWDLLLVLDLRLLEVLRRVGDGVLLLGQLCFSGGVAVDAAVLLGRLAVRVHAAGWGGLLGSGFFGFETVNLLLGFGNVLLSGSACW
jgi:hypothetical protein